VCVRACVYVCVRARVCKYIHSLTGSLSNRSHRYDELATRETRKKKKGRTGEEERGKGQRERRIARGGDAMYAARPRTNFHARAKKAFTLQASQKLVFHVALGDEVVKLLRREWN